MNLDALMGRALDVADSVRGRTSPNPWVGCVIVAPDGRIVAEGATAPPGGPHAEAAALNRAGEQARGATLVCTLEPCDHQGRTPPCTRAIIEAGIARVVVAQTDPDPLVSGRGIERLRSAGIEVVTDIERAPAETRLAPYRTHRITGRPWVTLKLAMTLDGRTAAPDGTSQWITGPEARTDTHRLRARADAICVGAGTVRADDPSLTVRHVEGPDPLRVVLGTAPLDARVHPCLQWQGELGELLDELGRRGVLELLVEGGATVAGAFHRAGLVDGYTVYVAPALFGGDDARPALAGPGAPTMAELGRFCFATVERLGSDLRIDLSRGEQTPPPTPTEAP